MAFALVQFYEENVWEVIPVGDIILEEHHKQRESLEGLKTLVNWEDRTQSKTKNSKGKGKGQDTKVPAQVIKVSNDKDYLFKVLKGDEDTPSKQGKGQRKRVINTKYLIGDNDDEDVEDIKPVSSKRQKTGKTQEDKRRNDNLLSMIKDKYKKASKSEESKGESSNGTGVSNEHRGNIDQLLRENNALKEENARLRQELTNVDDMKCHLRRLRRCVGWMERNTFKKNCGQSINFEEEQSLPKENMIKIEELEEEKETFQTPIENMIKIEASVESPRSSQELIEFPNENKILLVNKPRQDLSQANMITLGPSLVISSKVLGNIKASKVGSYVANIMGATLSREHMATHSLKGQKGKNGTIKPKLDAEYTKSLIDHVMSVTFTNTKRPVIEDDVVKAIKFKLNNEEGAWKKQNHLAEQKENVPQNENI